MAPFSRSGRIPALSTTRSPEAPRGRADLHVHTSHSPPHAGMLGHLRLPESHTSPQAAYALAMARGMDFVAITDHDTITGALELAHDPKVIVGAEISARFPHDGTMIHVIALGLSEPTHRMAQGLRDNVYELVEFLSLEGVFHFVAHPFYRMGRLGLNHFEQLLLLFKAFETRNGGKQLSPPSLLDSTLDSLTPGILMDLANKHDMAPYGPYPWRKTKVGGSDDHAGTAIGTTFTFTPPAADAHEFLAHLSQGRSIAGGRDGSVTSVASQYIGFASAAFAAQRPNHNPGESRRITVLRRLTGHPERAPSVPILPHLPRGLAARILGMLNGQSQVHRAVIETLLGDPQARRLALSGIDPARDDDSDLFGILARLAQGIADRLRASRDAAHRGLAWLIPALPALPLAAALVAEFRQRPLMRTIRRRHLGGPAVKSGLVCADLDASRVWSSRPFRLFMAPELRQETHLALLTPDTLAHSALMRGLRQGDATTLVDWVRRVAEGDHDRIYVVTTGPIGLLGIAVGLLLEIPVTMRFGRAERRLALAEYGGRGNRASRPTAVAWALGLVDEVRVTSEAAERAARSAGATSAQIRSMAPWRSCALDWDPVESRPGAIR
ncbi:PHP domain-containing protein [Candidatus Fermentibacteria bacterium]|nr:PHP domain-containing protein [Candidatus Fermentibacteria bacterium]